MIGKKDDTKIRISSYCVATERKPKTEEIEIKRKKRRKEEKKKRRREEEKSKIVEILAFYCVWGMKPTVGGSTPGLDQSIDVPWVKVPRALRRLHRDKFI